MATERLALGILKMSLARKQIQWEYVKAWKRFSSLAAGEIFKEGQEIWQRHMAKIEEERDKKIEAKRRKKEEEDKRRRKEEEAKRRKEEEEFCERMRTEIDRQAWNFGSESESSVGEVTPKAKAMAMEKEGKKARQDKACR